jgi:hypothetical protein
MYTGYGSLQVLSFQLFSKIFLKHEKKNQIKANKIKERIIFLSESKESGNPIYDFNLDIKNQKKEEEEEEKSSFVRKNINLSFSLYFSLFSLYLSSYFQ